ncbi:hypothetical protein [Alicyclobacillus ferrooxydans]|uniref:Uncharacterized protein n=1 Tax=Alicyclobacillus ferrooxydans TaxID=471514 RepID=A0A0P9EMH5_9BACL|nr:hypothetical protein [Alicyclobacillus ferrooxydans]KPV44567.1 hypothetical protein AN477_06085 [Alicyclobacillus ferrooxydans]
MYRSMRKHAESLIGKSVVAYHVEGIMYHGVLHSVTHEGIYIVNCGVLNPISANSDSPDVDHALGDTNQPDAVEVFAPFFFFPFGVLTGLAAANLARPPYYGYGPGYYGYGPGYGPYW